MSALVISYKQISQESFSYRLVFHQTPHDSESHGTRAILPFHDQYGSIRVAKETPTVLHVHCGGFQRTLISLPIFKSSKRVTCPCVYVWRLNTADRFIRLLKKGTSAKQEGKRDRETFIDVKNNDRKKIYILLGGHVRRTTKTAALVLLATNLRFIVAANYSRERSKLQPAMQQKIKPNRPQESWCKTSGNNTAIFHKLRKPFQARFEPASFDYLDCLKIVVWIKLKRKHIESTSLEY